MKFTCYHTTKKDRVENILREGLKPLSNPSYFSSPAPYIMLSDKPWHDLHGAESVVLAINDPQISPEYFDNPEGLRWPYPILPKHIELYQPPVTEKHIQAILMHYAMIYKQHPIAIPNSRDIMNWEADILSWTKARYIHEFEIKLDIYDFRADFKKKRKHQDLKKPWPFPPGAKYIHRTPNYFWYVTCNFFIRPPEYAGWIYIKYEKGIYDLYVQKPPPLIHKDKLPEKEDRRIMRILAWRVKNMYQSRFIQGKDIGYFEFPHKKS